ncbi:zinc metalloprotease HtpX [Thermomicrobiaceae bacterium CFH 74404]|uniref:Protease HtpX homolog n=1 Tax=Thermalbibacter longus TaxID=2951981 RepID=A0AA41WHG4_9BACT|nr:zinc metalloprotease HtpX [Thermalbibacter longus]MCM8750535.1 zinc metalloprotease HtpX [Thermalbibacter longus]
MAYSMRRVVKWSADPGLAARMLFVMGLLALVYLAFMAVLISSGFDTVTILIIAAIMAGFQYFFSDKIALLSVGARVVDPRQAPDLHAMVERLAALADVPKPKVAIVDTPVPNAFATGRSPRAAVVAVTTGLLDTLEPREVEAVLAHEIAHVRNRDVMVMTIASFFAVVAQLIVRMLSWSGSWSTRRDRREGGGSALLLVFFVSLAVYFVSHLLVLALSRYREFAADRGAALITGAPSQLMSALLKISGVMQRIPDRDLREVSELNAFFIIPAIKGSSLMELFSTHPSLERRLERLRELAREMEGL